MRRMRWITCCWPGLSRLWLRGSWPALAVAVVAAGLLNWTLLVSLGYSELISPDVRKAFWVTLVTVWVTGAVSSVVWNRGSAEEEASEADTDTFKLAVEHYLKGNWFQAERALNSLLHRDPRDVDARLMSATLLRHTGRHAEAGKQLEILMRCEGAAKWDLEIRRERKLLAEATEKVDGQAELAQSAGTSGPTAEQKHAA